MLALFGTMGKMAAMLPNLANPEEQIQDLFAACQCIREYLEQENAPESLGLLQAIETSLKENKFDIIEYIKKLESAFNSEAKIKLEVLFLPYKASMWDSLESIYLAAKEDPDCDAFVMPIPHYDKKNDKFTEMHWETDYPKNIPLIDYRKYNIEERCPDMIFIHNPYDGANIVTSVHPDYYSDKLRNFTNCLVYVPYFVGDGKNVGEHFCTLPACIFAHKVILQTEEERKTYISIYREFAKKSRHEKLDKIGEKFLALGSPKLDKVINAKREDYEIPKEWKMLINNADGTGKRVIFYNTSIGALLENSIENNMPSNKYLQKVKSVFEFFKKQKEAILLWRPHPLLESTIKSMRPWLEQEYAQIVNEYKSNGYGIYDDSQDLNRAIALCDMYYGDGSSVMQLFKSAAKPVCKQEFKQMPIVSGIWDDGIYVWFIDVLNMLYRYNKQSKKTEYMGMITGQDYQACNGIAQCNNKLYFAPNLANEIFAFDIDKKKFEQINFENESKINIKNKFRNAICFKNFIYFIPSKFPAIMRLNTDTGKIEYFSKWVDEAFKGNFAFRGFCVNDTEIIFVVNGANALMFFNMETGSYEIKNIGEENEQYNTICFDGQNYYISSFYKNYIIKWNRQSNEFLKIKFPNTFSRKESKGGNFLIKHLNRYIWLFPIAANNTYKINANTSEITELPELMEHFEDKNLIYSIFVKEDLIYASTMNKGIVEYNINTRKLNFIKRDLKPDLWLYPWLYDYDNRKSKLEVVVKNENSGEKIWEYFK
jgi:hypothetical protein